VLAALRPPVLRIWAAAVVAVPLVPGAASASVWEQRTGQACEVRAFDEALAADVLARCEAAVPVVSGFWPSWDERVVVVVARDVADLEAMLPGTGDLTDVAALATDAVFVNPTAYATLTAAGRQVVLTHEVTHIATREVVGVPTWLAEGFAETVAHADGAIPVEVAAQELAAEVRAGHVPETLPADAAFGTGDVAVHYEQAWRAVELVRRRAGRAALLRWYLAAGDPAALGTSTEELRRSWRDDLVRTFR